MSKANAMNNQSADEKIRFAIANKLMMAVTYSGSLRLVEPHDYGVQKGTTRLLAYQHSGPAKSGRKSLSGWRLFDVGKIGECRVLDQSFSGSRGASHQHHYAWDVLHARVT